MQWHKILGSDSSLAEESSFVAYDAVLCDLFHIFHRIICLYLQGQAVNEE
jgi:hypothetical protein